MTVLLVVSILLLGAGVLWENRREERQQGVGFELRRTVPTALTRARLRYHAAPDREAYQELVRCEQADVLERIRRG